ncbi:thiol:disulfide interchange protein DsbA/DsbL [Solilutibacter silvestris]|uniref:Thioredoxin n=1 Tax=Solilutibacter silvestris TaxID=1645665 RepID=A0A2K1Q1L8_9GAMM|nr:thiol:disulfide interchange protein DsbA/DsbL [Lysobacter silvestris]PNS08935.1 Thioredoxin [Lysobacter silvestris]
MRTLVSIAALALVATLSACKPSADSAPAATAPASSTPAADSSTPAKDSAPASTASTTPPAPPVSHVPTGPAPVEGKDYEVVANGQPFDPVDGKIEVTEVFNYVCPACAAFEPMFAPWAKSLPADVHVTHLAAPFGRMWDDYARAYYAAEALGVVDRTHQAMFDEIHVKQTLKGEHGTDGIDAIAAFYGRQGVDVAQFKSAASSFAVESKLAKAKQYTQAEGVSGTPTLIIDGKYRITGGQTRDEQLKIADALIAKERAARGGH